MGGVNAVRTHGRRQRGMDTRAASTRHGHMGGVNEARTHGHAAPTGGVNVAWTHGRRKRGPYDYSFFYQKLTQ